MAYRVTCNSCKLNSEKECQGVFGTGLICSAYKSKFKKHNKADTPKCPKSDCVYYAKSAKTHDNCKNGAFGLEKCEYIARENTGMKEESKKEEALQSVYAGIREKGNEITLGEILNLLHKYQVEIVLRPLK